MVLYCYTPDQRLSPRQVHPPPSAPLYLSPGDLPVATCILPGWQVSSWTRRGQRSREMPHKEAAGCSRLCNTINLRAIYLSAYIQYNGRSYQNQRMKVIRLITRAFQICSQIGFLSILIFYKGHYLPFSI